MEKQPDPILQLLYSIILFLSIILAIYSAYHFTTGFHNIDLGHNLKIINIDYGLDLVDRNSAGEIWYGSEMYAHGQGQMRESFVLLGLSVFFIGFSLSKLVRVN